MSWHSCWRVVINGYERSWTRRQGTTTFIHSSKNAEYRTLTSIAPYFQQVSSTVGSAFPFSTSFSPSFHFFRTNIHLFLLIFSRGSSRHARPIVLTMTRKCTLAVEKRHPVIQERDAFRDNIVTHMTVTKLHWHANGTHENIQFTDVLSVLECFQENV